MDLDNLGLKVINLYQQIDLIDQCIHLLNEQWPRSKSARQRSLEQGSADSLPTSLVLIEEKDSLSTVIGHSKILPVPYDSTKVFVESVLITPKRRGKGLGKFLMNETENYVKKLGVHTVYLTTHDQQEFYKKLGYEFCDPIIIYGGGSTNFYKKIMDLEIKDDIGIGDQEKVISKIESLKVPIINENLGSNDGDSIDQKQLPPTPPPPPPSPIYPHKNSPENDSSQTTNLVKVTMKKVLI